MAEENKNIFEGAEFGDKFITRDGRKAVFLGEWKLTIKRLGLKPTIYKLWVEDEEDPSEYSSDGLCDPNSSRCEDDDGNVEMYGSDLVSRYQEEIDEVELDELAHEDLSTCGIVQTKEEQISYIFGFKAGYHQRAKEER